MTQRADGHLNLRTLLAFMTVLVGAFAAIGWGAQRATIDEYRGRLGLAAVGATPHADHQPALLDHAASQCCACWYTSVHGGRSFGIHGHGATVYTM
jgi:hypothetical protein